MEPVLPFTTLQATWFALIGLLLALYAALDGMDLGVGILHYFAKDDHERRVLLNSIGPVWDGNEVYLLTGGGALFAAFPEVYATAFSGFYLALVLVLLALISRAVSLEFRSKEPMAWWTRAWDAAFFGGSLLAALLMGVALGNVARGVPLDAEHEYAGGFFTLLNPYSLLVGLATVALFAQQGALWVVLKSEGALHARFSRLANWVIGAAMAGYVLITVATLSAQGHMLNNYLNHPVLWLIPGLTVLAVLATPWAHAQGWSGRAFIFSSLTVLGVMASFGASVFPNMLRASNEAANSLNIVNGASTEKTLGIMLIIACIGMPLVLGYSGMVYWIFRGKVKLEKNSY